MSRILILAEGLTEKTFVEGTLAAYLHLKGIYPRATVIPTRHNPEGADYKGGIVSYGKVKPEIQKLLGDTNAALVTTMIDFYSLPSDFPNYKNMPSGTPHQKVAFLEKSLAADIDHIKFFPYFALHEFEAMLFADPTKIAEVLDAPQKLPDLQNIRSQVKNPEIIDDQHPPSKRLQALFPTYDKHSYLSADEIGLERIRAECPHFNEWLVKLENLGS